MAQVITNETYKGYEIECNCYGRNEFTVSFEGDDVWFETLDEAKAFIDSMEEFSVVFAEV